MTLDPFWSDRFHRCALASGFLAATEDGLKDSLPPWDYTRLRTPAVGFTPALLNFVIACSAREHTPPAQWQRPLQTYQNAVPRS